MNHIDAINNGLTVKSELPRWIPHIWIDDKMKFIPVHQAEKETGIHRTTIIERIISGDLIGEKRGFYWFLRLKSYQKLVETYRYGKIGMNTGKWWTPDELEILKTGLSHKKVAKLLNRSYQSIKVKRCKLNK